VRPSPLSLGSLACVGLVLLVDPLHSRHGGVFRGPGVGLPPGVAPPGVGAAPGPTTDPRSGSNDTADGLAWDRWWRFNQDRYVRLKEHVWATETVTGSDDFFLGRGLKRPALPSPRPTEDELQDRVVPALLRLLNTATSTQLRTASAIAVAKVGGGNDDRSGALVQAALERRLDEPNQELREAAAIALGILGRESAAFVLADLLADSEAGRARVGGEVDTRTRAFAAYGLGLIGQRTEREDVRRFVVHKLVGALDGSAEASEDVPVAAVIALGLVPLAIAGDDDVGERTLATTSRQGQILELLARLDDPRTGTLARGHVPVSVARLVPGLSRAWKERVVGSLLAPLALASKARDEVREGAVQALGLLLDGDADPVDRDGRATLARLTQEGSQEVRRFALIALARSAARPGRGDFEPALDAARELLHRRLARSPMVVRPWAALALAELERSVSALGRAASEESLKLLRKTLQRSIAPEEVGGLAIALGLIADREAEPILRKKLDTLRHDGARGHLAVGLGLVRSFEALEDLRELVDSARFRPNLLRSAATGLGLLRDPELASELTTMLAEAKSLSSQAAVAQALGWIGDRTALEPLLAMALESDLVDGARTFAVVSLGIVGDKDPRPWNAQLATDVNYAALTSTLSDPSGRGILDIL